jgi:hypothetical protein
MAFVGQSRSTTYFLRIQQFDSRALIYMLIAHVPSMDHSHPLSSL